MAILFSQVTSYSQIFYTKSGKISFYSKAPLEDIESVNKTVDCIFNTTTGSIQFSALIKSFEFQKALMQEHFNENYLESNKFPRSNFKGTVVNNAQVDYNKPGTYSLTVKGDLTIHGITKTIEVNGTIKTGTSPELEASFPVKLSDFAISIPSIVKDKVSNNVKVQVSAKLEPYKK
jgi:Uncharacterized conserved protein